MAKKRYLILIIDDDEFLLDMYALKFREAGFDVEVAFNGGDALEKIRQGLKPDVVLFDLIMPNMDGWGLVESIKKEKLLDNTKFIVLSNLGQKEDIEKGKALGVSDYIVKAYFTPSEIVNKVEAILEGQ